MAHPGRKGPRHLAAACVAALAATAFDSHSITLGEARVRSALGEPLDLRIPVTLDAGESIEPGCFKLRAPPAADVPRMESGRISVVRSAGATALRVQSPGPVIEPALQLSIVAACAGQSGEYRRDYSLLIDPPAAARGRAVPPAATPSLRAIAATLIARIGDTLESIAHAIFPDNRSVRRSYIEALRETNPQLATLGDNDPIPVATPIALPDLRAFAHARHPSGTEVAQAPRDEAPKAVLAHPDATTELAQSPREAAKPREKRAAASKGPPRQTSPPPAAPREAQAQTKPATPAQPKASGFEAVAPAPPRSRDGTFVLKLSSSQVDLSRSRGIDDRARAQLRERQMILDQDDQVAALLALRHSVQQLESRVTELQLKLAAMPSSFPPPRPAIAPIQPPVVPAPAATPPPPPAAPQPPAAAKPAQATPVATAPAEPKPAPAEKPAPAVVAKAPEPPKEKAPEATAQKPPSPAPQPASEAPKPAAEKPARREVSSEEWIRYGLWVLAVLLLFAAGLLTWRLVARRRAAVVEPPEEALPPPVEDDRIVVADEAPVIAAPAPAPPRVEVAADGRRIIDADVHLTTRLGDDSDALRRRYIEERFPEITKGAIALDDPDSVVKGARLFYEDGAIARAVELLQLAIERHPAELKAWLALFEIFRLERLTGEFAGLARRFQEQHGASPFWPKVQYFGREIDPGNALYQVAPINKFETIGPAQAKRIAAETMFDPIAENWLAAPMDFQNEVLANELRKAIMQEAGIAEPDLVPNPMPALRNIEMFTVA